MRLFLDGKVPGGPALPAEQVRDDPHVRFRGMILEEDDPVAGPFTMLGNPVRIDGRTTEVRIPAPAVGEHTEQVLGELGYSSAQIAERRAVGAI
jgi:formyl-CoA transferase